MLGVVRLVVFGFIILSIIYLAISLYSRSIRREKLENAWAEDHPGDEDSPERLAFLEKGMLDYHQGLRRKLILLVYIIPTIAIAVIAYLVNAT